MRRVSILAGAFLIALATMTSASLAATAYYSGVLNSNSPTFHHPNASTVGTAMQFYSVQPFTVDASGTYIIESASPNTTGTPSNALDTFLALYANTFTPATPGAGQNFNDDFTGALTVLPGPFVGNGVTSAGTGFSGTQPSSRIATANLVAGTQYFLVNTSFRSTDFVGTGTTAQPVGTFYTGISGPGNISIPEPASLGLLAGMATLIVSRRRRAN